MRTLMKIQVPDAAPTPPESAQMVDQMIEQLHPEAMYFYAEDGHRTALIVFDMEDPSQMPLLAGPLHDSLGARVQFSPVMNIEAFKRGIEQLAQAALQPA